MGKKIPLTNSRHFALVDDDDFPLISQYKWRYVKAKMPDGCGYASLAAKRNSKRRFLMHNIIMCLCIREVDHRDGCGLNNQRHNLRYATRSQQCMNRHRGSKRKGTSRYKGVRWWSHGRRWQARIRVAGCEIHLGYFKDETKAASAYNEAALKYFGEFACPNVLLEGKK